ncbi:MAG: low specificity L-threonine aldolase, partial [Nocardioidaceae bacterium]|nr:low specificity L-threonine aldolase [Nocardioidaceae bacterium]
WRQAGMLAAAGLYALDHHVDRLAEDHANARLIAATAGVDESDVETNIVVLPTNDAAGVVARCRAEGVHVSAVGPRVVRAVTHLDITTQQAKTAAEVIARSLST